MGSDALDGLLDHASSMVERKRKGARNPTRAYITLEVEQNELHARVAEALEQAARDRGAARNPFAIALLASVLEGSGYMNNEPQAEGAQE